jgi:hypothetical protein
MKRREFIKLIGGAAAWPLSVIVATGGSASAIAAKAATTTIPIVFLTPEDPVRLFSRDPRSSSDQTQNYAGPVRCCCRGEMAAP